MPALRWFTRRRTGDVDSADTPLNDDARRNEGPSRAITPVGWDVHWSSRSTDAGQTDTRTRSDPVGEPSVVV